MPHWNEELQQWGFHYYEDYQPGEWLGINRRIEMPPTLDQNELVKRATYHAPTAEAKALHELNRKAYLSYATFVMESIPESREASVAQTNLEQVLFWVNAAIARNHDKIK